VVGPGGPLQHWGIGRWHGAGAVRIWGAGHNILPFVLIDDVAEALVRMIEAPVTGQSFNLIGEPMLSARGYFNEIHRLLGARIRVVPGNLHGFYAGDAVKYALKKYALRRPGVLRPSLADWKSRAHLARFDNARPKAVLGWQPEADRAAFSRRAIAEAGLFGF
jgi:nucleoside-diphosphate-sugar epimerase